MGNETKNYKFPKPSEDDFYDISEYNKAMDILDETLTDMNGRKLDHNGNASNTVTEFNQEILRENIESGEKLSVSHGKIQKWFSEMKNIAFSGLASDATQDAAHRFVTDTEKNNWNAKVSASAGDISGTKIGSLEKVTSEFPVPAEGETSKVFLGKVKKFIQDFNDFKAGIITVGKLVNNGQTTAAGYALDARYGKTLYDLYVQLNSDLVLKANASDLTNTNSNLQGQIAAINSNLTVHKTSGDHDSRYYTKSEITGLLAGLKGQIIFFSNVIDASTGNKTQNVILQDTSNYLLVLNKGANNYETGLILLTTRNNSIYQTPIKTIDGITIATYQLTLGITYSYPDIGIATITKLGN